MQKPIDQLEDRVNQAVARLRQLAGERNGLQVEVGELREELERRAAALADGDGDGEALDRETVLTGLRRALDELRAE